MNAGHVIGVDVGTGSARAGIFDLAGTLVATARHDITLYHERGDLVEQSSTEIWDAVCQVVRAALARAGLRPEQIAGIGFDATCSLVVLGAGGRSLPVGPSEDPARDIIVWMDHRAVAEAERINATRHPVLAYVGGRISPEMETPKLAWLQSHRPAVFDAAWQFFDLTDFLTWRASGDLARSTCTLTCKWTYLAHERCWDPSYFRAIGLGQLADEDWVRIGQRVVDPGTPLGQGLTAAAAAELGLAPGTPVAAGAIDAHAGGIGTVGAGGGSAVGRLAYVFGTSSCTMTTTLAPVFVPGVWGPYYSAMVPDAWLNEGGQSVAGAAIDRLLALHPEAPRVRLLAQEAGQSLPEMLAAFATAAAGDPAEVVQLAEGLHVVPEFLGNRAPRADPQARAVIAGLGMAADVESLVALYVAGLCGIGYGLRQIIAAQARAGAPVEQVVLSGGAGRLDLVRQLLADATGLPVVVARTEEPVLLGAAMLGAVASRHCVDLATAMATMSHVGRTYAPTGGATASRHTARFEAFERLQAVAAEIR